MAAISTLRARIAAFLHWTSAGASSARPTIQASVSADGFTRHTVTYESEGMPVEAYLFAPDTPRDVALIALHQHNSQWRLGKSEIAGLAGDPHQAFGPALARRGVTVLAPDALGFESRMGTPARGTDSTMHAPRLPPERGSTSEDWLQFYNHAMHRLVRGELLISRVLTDVASATSALHALCSCARVGVLGHSYGGLSALFAGAVQPALAFVVSSGALCSYRYKLEHGVGLDMSLVIPGFATTFDLDDLLRCIAPRPVLVVSSDADPYSADATELVALAADAFAESMGTSMLAHLRTEGAHALDLPRFEAIIEWVTRQD